MAERQLKVTIVGQDKSGSKTLAGLGSAADEAESKLDRLGGRFQDVGGKMMGFGAKASVGLTLPLAAAGKAVFDAGSDMAETLSKSNTIFAEQGAAIEQWASGAAKGFGQSKQQALEAAATFGNLFIQLGVGRDQAAGMSKQMVELASDFASFHNADPSDVLDAMTAAFRGEYDAVQRFVPTINAATVEHKALEMGLKGTTKELTAQDKAIATQALLLEGAGAAVGDFARTSDSAANKQRTLTAQFKDASAALGESLMPIVQKVIEFFGSLAEKFNSLSPGVQQAILVVAGLAAVMGPLVTVIGAVATAIGFLMSPVGLIIAGVALLAFVIVKNWDTIKETTLAVWGAITGFLGGAWEWIKNTASAVWDAITSWISDRWENVKNITTGVWDSITGFISGTWETIKSTISGAIDSVVGFVSGMASRIWGAAQGMWDGIVGAFRAAINTIIRGWNAIEFRVPGFSLGPISFGGFTLGLPDIPYLAKGGRIAESGWAITGEKGPELGYWPKGAVVAPLSKYSDAELAAISASQPHGPGNISASGGYRWAHHPTLGPGYYTDEELRRANGAHSGVTVLKRIEIPITLTMDSKTVARTTARYDVEELKRHMRRNGGRI